MSHVSNLDTLHKYVGQICSYHIEILDLYGMGYNFYETVH